MEDQEIAPLVATAKDDEDEVVLTGCGATLPCDPRRNLHRYLVLIVMCFLSFGSYFCYDNPAALQDEMREDLDLTGQQYMNFYAWYSWPNVILCFFGGYLIDSLFGVRLGAIIFSSLVTVGQIIFASGAFLNAYWLMNLGRFVFGIGGESLCVAQNTYAVNWFIGKELNMVFGLQLSFSRAGSTVNMNVMRPLYDALDDPDRPGHKTLGIALLIAAVFCVFSVICALVLAFFDFRAKRILKKEVLGTGEKIRLWDVKDFDPCVWVLCIICVSYYVAIFPFIGIGLVFFENKYDMTPTKANGVNSLVYIVAAVASPVFGFLIDKTGKNIFWVMAGCLVTLGCHAALAFTFINPFIVMFMMGLSYSVLASALWPMVAMLVPQHQLGTAYGIMQSVQNLGLAVISIVAGTLADQKGYLALEVFFQIWLCASLIACSVLYIMDAAKGGTLNRSARQRSKVAALESEIEGTT